jgi:hypothetical protein
MDRVEEKAGFKLTIGQEIPQKSGASKWVCISTLNLWHLYVSDHQLFSRIDRRRSHNSCNSILPD